MKIYARQIMPEFQDSRIFDDDGNGVEYINVWGNKDYQSRTSSVFDRVKECLDAGELAEDIEAVMEKNPSAIYGNITEAINNQLWRDDGKPYSTRQIGKLKQLVLRYSECRSSEEDQILVDVLSIVTGEEWDYRNIHGCCQSEWNTVYYPVKYWTKESLDAFETMYFNTGSEWIVHEGDTEPTSPEEIDGCAYYCVSWNDEGIKKELAEAAGGNVEDVVLYKYSGSVSIPTYKVA
jgi:hypothetical protein